MRKHTQGYTMIEILVVISILLLLTAISYPVLVGAKRKAGEMKSVSNLRQLYYALAIYRTEHDGDGIYGQYDPMGLPPGLEALAKAYKLPHSAFLSGGVLTLDSDVPPLFYVMWCYPVDAPEFSLCDKQWLDEVLSQEENTVILVDLWHNYGIATVDSEFVTRKGIGLRLNGSVETRNQRGDPLHFDYWDK